MNARMGSRVSQAPEIPVHATSRSALAFWQLADPLR